MHYLLSSGYNFWYDFVLNDIRNEALRNGNLNRTILGEGNVYLDNEMTYHPAALSAAEDARYDSDLIHKGRYLDIHLSPSFRA
jgi:hypothetical protein